MAQVKKRKALRRLEGVMERARTIVQQLADGTEDPFICYGRLHKIYCAYNTVHDQFRQFFSIPGVDPCGHFNVDDEFRRTVRKLAQEWLAKDVASATPAALSRVRRVG